MTNYYIEKDNKIIFVDTDLERLQNTVALGEYSELEIKETERPIVNFEFADTPEYLAEELAKAKEAKMQENNTKAYAYIDTKRITKIIDDYECVFLLNKETQMDLSSSAIGFLAGIITTKQWTATNGFTVQLTQEDIANILLDFDNTINPIWALWGTFKIAIENAITIEELNAINIDYN